MRSACRLGWRDQWANDSVEAKLYWRMTFLLKHGTQCFRTIWAPENEYAWTVCTRNIVFTKGAKKCFEKSIAICTVSVFHQLRMMCFCENDILNASIESYECFSWTALYGQCAVHPNAYNVCYLLSFCEITKRCRFKCGELKTVS